MLPPVGPDHRAWPGVAVIPGSASGTGGRIRICFASEVAQLGEGFARIRRASARLVDAGPRGMQHEWTQR